MKAVRGAEQYEFFNGFRRLEHWSALSGLHYGNGTKVTGQT
jgi:hypothetical protein